MSEWKEYRLEDFATIHNETRIPLSKMERSKRQGKYPYYGASGVIDYLDDYLFDGEYILISEDGENLKSRQTPIAFKANGQFWVNNHAHIVKGKKDFHNNLIIYYFKNLDLNPFITGAVQPKLNKANLLSIPIFLPKKEEEQKAIAEVLSSLDDKIDLLHRQNKTLEQMAETLFRQWFVEDAKEDWEETTLGNIAKFFNGKKRPEKQGDIPIYGGNGILGYSKLSNFFGKSIIVGRVGAYCGSIYYENKDIWVSDNALLVKAIEEKHTHYLFYLLRTLDLNSMAEGSSHPLITQTLLKTITVVQPPRDKIKNFEQQLESIRNKTESNQLQIRTLEKMRDTLLPKLMSGEVRIM